MGLNLADRIKSLIPAGTSQDIFARDIGVPVSTFKGWLGAGRPPKSDALIRIANFTGCDLNWLLLGKEPARPANPNDIPIIGLAQCGLKGWYNEGPLAVSAPRPPDFIGPNAFAVIAVGRSMEPAGILAGQLCYCDPDVKPRSKDAVYIRKKDGTASIKVYGGVKENTLIYQGWLFDKDEDHGTPYIEEIPCDYAVLVTPIIFIKRRA